MGKILENGRKRFEYDRRFHNDEQFVFGTSLGLGALDVMIGYQMYENASKVGLGTQLKLWNKPLWE